MYLFNHIEDVLPLLYYFNHLNLLLIYFVSLLNFV